MKQPFMQMSQDTDPYASDQNNQIYSAVDLSVRESEASSKSKQTTKKTVFFFF